MDNRYFSQESFNNNFGREMNVACDVYERRKESGMRDSSIAAYDFIFISDTRAKLELLAEFLSINYNYKINKIKNQGEYWELTGDATEFPVDENNLMYWALDLYCKGFQFDCEFEGYGAIADKINQIFLPMTPDLYNHYFDLAMHAYDKQNLGMAIIHFSTAIKINPDDPNAWYSRAIIKDELHTWKAARRDYDKAIELAPNFIDAIVNRAANKDDAGEYDSAIEDYNRAILIDPMNAMVYFNRGNSRHNKNDKNGACEDWEKARELGADYAQERIDSHCLK